MPISPLAPGDGRLSHHSFTIDGGGVFVLTGVADNQIALHMQDVNSNNALYVCTGTWHVTSAAGGLADFTPSAADITTGSFGRVGLYKIYPVVTLSSGPVPMDAQMIQIIAEP